MTFYFKTDNRLRPGTIELQGGNYNTLENDQTAIRSNFGSTSSINADAQGNKDASVNDMKNLSLADKSEEEQFSPTKFPDAGESLVNKAKFYISYPLYCLLYFTVPDSRKPERQSIFMVTFVMSLFWLCMFSYVMVWMITIIGKI